VLAQSLRVRYRRDAAEVKSADFFGTHVCWMAQYPHHIYRILVARDVIEFAAQNQNDVGVIFALFPIGPVLDIDFIPMSHQLPG
jgi:hypothetical protein